MEWIGKWRKLFWCNCKFFRSKCLKIWSWLLFVTLLQFLNVQLFFAYNSSAISFRIYLFCKSIYFWGGSDNQLRGWHNNDEFLYILYDFGYNWAMWWIFCMENRQKWCAPHIQITWIMLVYSKSLALFRNTL